MSAMEKNSLAAAVASRLVAMAMFWLIAPAACAAGLTAYPLPVPVKQNQVTDTAWPLPAPEGYSMSMNAAGGESGSASFVLHTSEALSGIAIQASDLSGPSVIPASNVDLRLVKTWYQGSATGPGKGSSGSVLILIPELLVKDDALIKTGLTVQKSYLRTSVNGAQQYLDITTTPAAPIATGAIVQDAATLQPFSMAANTNKQVWITMTVPAATPAGVYGGTITVSVPGKPDTAIAFSVKVLPFTLSPSLIEEGIFYRALLKDSCPALSSECKTQAQMAAEFADMMAHGISYPTVYDSIGSSLLAARLSLMEQAGMPKDKIYQTGDGLGERGTADLSNIAMRTAKWNSFAASHGWGQVYTFGVDEVRGTVFDSQMPAFDAIHANGGKVFNSIPDAATALRPGIYKIDVPILYGVGMHSGTIETMRRMSPNSKVSMYGDPFSDSSNPESVRNHFGFAMLYKNYDAAMNYVYQDGCGGSGNIWNNFDGAHYNWTYPTSNGVVDTLQWEGNREAVNDIRYASTLAARKGWTKPQLVAYLRSLPALNENPDAIDAPAARQAIVDAILATQAGIGGGAATFATLRDPVAVTSRFGAAAPEAR
ncbi:MAG: hypothetical protein ACLPX9_12760 [Rhodomicrobium sp.]